MLRSLALSTLALFCLVGVPAGCKTTSPESVPRERLEGKSNRQILYEAIVETFEEENLPVDTASLKLMIVTSKYQRLSENLRRRFIARIVPAPGGATGLRLRAEFQRRGGGEGEWEKVASDGSGQLAERAEEEELDILRTIERRFRRWKDATDQ